MNVFFITPIIKEITQLILQNIKYQEDYKRGYYEYWQLPHETIARRTGDCEDMSILLMEILLKNGIQSFLAVGRYNGNGHAWVIVQCPITMPVIIGCYQLLDQYPVLLELHVDATSGEIFEKNGIMFSKLPENYQADEVTTLNIVKDAIISNRQRISNYLRQTNSYFQTY